MYFRTTKLVCLIRCLQENNLEHTSMYLTFTCGLIRDGLSNLGIKSIVTAEVSLIPACEDTEVVEHTEK